MNTTVVIPKSVYIDEIKGHEGRTIRNIEEKTKTKIRRPYDSNPADRKLTVSDWGVAYIRKSKDTLFLRKSGRNNSRNTEPTVPSIGKDGFLQGASTSGRRHQCLLALCQTVVAKLMLFVLFFSHLDLRLRKPCRGGCRQGRRRDSAPSERAPG